MDFKKTLEKLKKEIDRELEKYLSVVVRNIKKKDKETGRMLQHAAKIIMSSGKRIRPILMYFGYVGAGGKDRKKIIKASIGLELVHNFLLIHDDIMDHGEMRHGVKTVNKMYEEIIPKIFPLCNDKKHLANSMAINTGDFIQILANEAFLKSGFDFNLTIKANNELQNIIAETIVGQVQDICVENKKQTSEKEVLEIYKNKTAQYTIEGPLKLGAILAGANENFLKKISLFAIPIGMAFQIQDDILGIFEKGKKIGKDSGSDIREGKKTLLVLAALKKADKKDKKFIEKTLGNKKAFAKDIRKFKEIIRKTGSLKYNQKLAQSLAEKGKKELEKNNLSKEAKNFLFSLADYIIVRKV